MTKEATTPALVVTQEDVARYGKLKKALHAYEGEAVDFIETGGVNNPILQAFAAHRLAATLTQDTKMTEANEVLLPRCPLCDGLAEIQKSDHLDGPRVDCLDCGMRGPVSDWADFKTDGAAIEDAIARWSTRAATAEPPQVGDIDDVADQVYSLYEDASNNPCTCNLDENSCRHCTAWSQARRKAAEIFQVALTQTGESALRSAARAMVEALAEYAWPEGPLKEPLANLRAALATPSPVVEKPLYTRSNWQPHEQCIYIYQFEIDGVNSLRIATINLVNVTGIDDATERAACETLADAICALNMPLASLQADPRQGEAK